MSEPGYLITASPHLRGVDSTPKIMWHVVGSLVPIIGVATYLFGPSALLVTAASTLGAVLTERAFGKPGAWRDGSAMITGLLLGLCLPAGMPLWMPFLGSVFGIGFGKLIFGGLGQNVFNPALLGRAFLQAAFPVAITTWPAIVGVKWWSLRGPNLALPLMGIGGVDAVTTATPLGLMKFEHTTTSVGALAFGNVPGSVGETSAVIILLCGAYLAFRNYLNWRIPVSILLTVGAFSAILHLVDPRYPTAGFMVFSGGLMLGAVYMATDMVTSPIGNAGAWIFGVGIGALVVLIRIWGGLPEGVMYAILIMNAIVPSINRLVQPRVFGTRRRASA